MQQTLMHLYYYTLLEKLQTCQFTPSQLVEMINETEEVYLLTLLKPQIYINVVCKSIRVDIFPYLKTRHLCIKLI